MPCDIQSLAGAKVMPLNFIVWSKTLIVNCALYMCGITLHPAVNACACIHVNSFKETRQSKQLRPKTTPFFLEKK